MNSKNIFHQIRCDCFRCSSWTHLFSFLASLLSIISPTLVSWLIGDMTDYLLEFDFTAIRKQFPFFICAIALTVVVTPLVDLIENLRLTQDGFNFENQLMNRLLRSPFSHLQTLDKGTVVERLTSEPSALIYNQLILHTRPAVLIIYGSVVFYLFTTSRIHFLYFVAILISSCLPTLRSIYIGKRYSTLKAQTAEYAETRRTLEQELVETRDLCWGYRIDNLLIGNLNKQYKKYIHYTGSAFCRLDALEKVLDFLCNHGAQIATILFGSILISKKMLTVGTLLGGLLMQSAIASCCEIVHRLIWEVQMEKTILDRLVFMYAEMKECVQEPTKIYGLTMNELSYTYPNQSLPALSNFNLTVSPGKIIRLVGANGSGKSTLLSVLGGLYPPNTGSICDETGSPVNSEQLYSNVALCRQDGTIFSGTVAENLFLPQTRMQEAYNLLHRMGFNKSLSYVVESGGANLSYGERKKVLLVRALLKEATILALDEPLNHLDLRGQSVLAEVLRGYSGSLIYVSHEDFLEGDDLVQHVDLKPPNYQRTEVTT